MFRYTFCFNIRGKCGREHSGFTLHLYKGAIAEEALNGVIGIDIDLSVAQNVLFRTNRQEASNRGADR